MRQVIHELDRLRRRSRRLLLGQRLAVLGAWTLGTILALVGLDFLLRLPGTPRLILLAAAAGGLAWALRAYLWPALQFRPGLTDLALRAERVIPAVAGHLASSVEFAAAGIDRDNPLAARSIRETESRLAGESLARVLTASRTGRDLTAFALVAALAATLVALSPQAAATGVARLFAPYGSAQWPARTAVSSLMHEVLPATRVHPRGQALLLRARVTKGQPDHVAVRYRTFTDGDNSPWRHLLLTDQGRGIHERLIDANADGAWLAFETEDAGTELERIDFVEPPAVERAALTSTPPAYAAPWSSPLEIDLGPGLDERAMTDAPALIGSEVTLEIEFNKPLPRPATPDDLRAALGWQGDAAPQLDAGDPASTWTLRWTLGGTTRLDLHLLDQYQLSNAESIRYVIAAVEDREPAVTILEPAADEPVLATAIVAVETEARDDVAISRIGLEATVLRGGVIDQPEEPLWQTWEDAGTAARLLRADLALAEHGLSKGDVVLLRGVAEDVYEIDGARHPAVRSPVRRLPIIDEMEFAARLRTSLALIRGQAIRAEAMQAELQDDVAADGVPPGIERAQARIGERIAAQREAVEDVRGQLQRNRLDDEQLAAVIDQAADLLDFAGRAAATAVGAIEERQAAQRAQGAPPGAQDRAAPPRGEGRAEQGRPRGAGDDRPGDEAAPDEPGEPPDAADRGADPEAAPGDDALNDAPRREAAEEDRPIVDAQQEVREELADLIGLLDRDEDAWIATRWLENLMEAQADLSNETAQAGSETVGREFDELTADQQSELRRIAERQSDLAAQGRQLLEDLRTRAEELKDVDRPSSEALREAAGTGERQELVREMDKAAEGLEENQLRSARESQQSAEQAMERMLEELRRNNRSTAQELLRRLASLIESIERLVLVQENELTALATARDGGAFGGRDRAMIRLAQNTGAVADEARSSGQEARRIARVLDRSSDAQGAAVVALRNDPVLADDAEAAEERSLELLREALDLSRELSAAVEERQLLQQREELVAAYRRFAEQQVALRAETEPLGAVQPLGRRELVEARRLAQVQERLRGGLDELRVATSDVNDSIVFRHVHERMDEWSRQVSRALDEGTADRGVTDRQQQIADAIGRLIEALETSFKPPAEFAGPGAGGSPGGGGGQQQQQPLIPPLAELKLIRGMQEQVYNLTRGLDGRADVDRADRDQRLRELGEDQRDLKRLGEEIVRALKEGQARPPEPQPQPEPQPEPEPEAEPQENR